MKKIILFILLIVIIIFGITFFNNKKPEQIKQVSKEKEAKVITYKDVTYENVIFSDIRYLFSDNTFTFTCDVSSLNEEPLIINSINIIFKNNDEEIGRLIGYIGGKLEYNNGKKIIAEGNADYSNASIIEFEFN